MAVPSVAFSRRAPFACFSCSGRNDALISSDFKEIGHVENPEYRPDERGHCTALRVMEEARLRKLQHAPLRFQLTAALRKDVQDPLRFASISQCDDESIATPKDHDGRTILATSFPSGMEDNA